MKRLRKKQKDLDSEFKSSSKTKLRFKLKFISPKWVVLNLLDVIQSFFKNLKNSFVYTSYWGRGVKYKQIVHVSIIVITVVASLSGLSYRILGLNSSANTAFEQKYFLNTGNTDLLTQGRGLNSVLVSNPNIAFDVFDHQVIEGESLQSIADKYGVTKDTIKWANLDKFGSYQRYTSESVSVGETYKIPEISGVLYAVKAEDTIDSVLSKTSGDRFSVIEVNQLQSPDFSLASRQLLLIPNGKLDAPPPPPPEIPIVAYYRSPSNVGVNADGTGNNPLNGVYFSNPLSNPECSGYSISRGYLPWHNGIDMAKYGGCSIRASCDGTVAFAGWSSYGEGYNVRIDCGGGVRTDYYHGDGNIWVSAGQQVSRGQDIMYMGCTGYCTGTHLHFGLRLDGNYIDAAPFVPF